MAETTNLSICMDRELKEQAEQLFSELGMNMTTALNILVRLAMRQGKIPFEITLNKPNAETIAAMEEANKMSRDPNANGKSAEISASVVERRAPGAAEKTRIAPAIFVGPELIKNICSL
ncbi:MAG: hypothetical protein DDT21_01010 [Syntrophomonadaceae bacterium]|nr:hypothetical protein [Bacillota bacterium]